MKKGERKCLECKIQFKKLNDLQSVCSFDCAINRAKRLRDKRETNDWKERKANLKKEVKSISDWKNDLQKEVNWIVRELDKDLPCISHPTMKDFLRYDAGHAYTVKSHSDIRFNVHNIHKQNSQANERYGYCVEYQSGIRERYGVEYLEMLEGLPLTWKGIGKEKFTISNIQGKYLPAARAIVRELKKGVTFTRDQVNDLIGIYILNYKL